MDHVVGCGSKLFAAICASDLEGIVAKWKYGRYHSDGCTMSWFKIKNPHYSQLDGRAHLFAARKPGSRSKSATPVLCPELHVVQRVL
jgi:ATP-dependent DNA ligase